MEYLRFYSQYLALAVAIYGLIKYKDYKYSKAKYFLYSIWLIVITEFVGEHFYDWFGIPNYPLYNVYTLILFVFYLCWFRSLIELPKRKRIVSAFIVIYVLFSVINVFAFQDFVTESGTYSYALGVIFVVTSICYYLIEVFNSEVVLRIRQSMYFWFSIAILLFHATYMPFFFAYKFFYFGEVKLLSAVNFTLCVLMYIFFGIGFLKAKHSANEHKLSE